jgi:hypothetical protein
MSDTESLSQYEEDFYIENEEHLQDRRSVLDKRRKSLKELKFKEPHWMRCPKCGEKMVEFKLLDILVDQCIGCNGLFFDNGELETLLDVSDRRGFFKSIEKTFYN